MSESHSHDRKCHQMENEFNILYNWEATWWETEKTHTIQKEEHVEQNLKRIFIQIFSISLVFLHFKYIRNRRINWCLF